jgi:surface antigen
MRSQRRRSQGNAAKTTSEGERMTRRITRGLAAAALAIVASLPAAPPLSAQLNSPFSRDSAGMSEQDWTLMSNARQEVLEQYRVGATGAWQSPTSGRAGTWVVKRTYQRDGMRCAQLTHDFTSGPGYDYTVPLCQVPDGSWKLAF